MERDEYTDRYVNPYTDFGFKKLFGTEMNKELLISFINSLLSGKEQIRDLTYLNTQCCPKRFIGTMNMRLL